MSWKISESATPVILAGGEIDSELGRSAGVKHTSHLVIREDTIFSHTLAVIEKGEFSEKPIVVSSHHPASERYHLIPDQGGLWPNIKAALEAADTDHIVTHASDMPYLRHIDVDKALRKMEVVVNKQGRGRYGIDFCYGVANPADCKKLIDMERTSYRFRKGDEYTGVNVMLVSQRVLQIEDLAEEVLSYRKNKRMLVKTLLSYGFKHHLPAMVPFSLDLYRGWRHKTSTVMRYKKLPGLISAITGMRCAVIDCEPRLAIDVDNLEQWEIAQQHPSV